MLLCSAAFAQSLMPVPAKLTPGQGRLLIDAGFRVSLARAADPRLERAAARLTQRLSRLTAIPFAGPQTAALAIEAKTAADDESYTLEVTPAGARLTAPGPLGVLRGLETFLQLVEPGPTGFAVPCLRIDDRPRFSWRGLMIDVVRHFQSVEAIKRNLDAMAALKLNVFHWHLSDNQGFRVECRRYPKLHELGSDGLYYTQDQVRQIIAYAADRGIRVIPEFDMPGHTTAWFVGYPELASAPGPYEIERHWGVSDPAMDPTREETYSFLDGFIAEMAALFPDPWFHIGGDEVNGKQWDSNRRLQEFKRDRGFKTNEQLQAYFNQRVFAILTRHGKNMVGWDEILEPGVPKDILIQSWRGQKSLAAAARQGYRGILSSGYYLDLMFPASRHYAVDPLSGPTASLTDSEKSLILGGEACMWAEMVSAENLDARIWPRMAAIAERLWSPAEVKDVDSMYRRLETVSARLEFLGLTHAAGYRTMTERLAGYRSNPALSTLLSVLEPVKEYARHSAREYTQFTPLNRAVDIARPESDVARRFSAQIDAFLAGDASRREPMIRQLTAWRDQHEELKPLFATSFLTAELEPISQTVSDLASAALGRLAGRTVDTQPLLDRAKKPQAELLISILPALEKLLAKHP